MAKLHADFTAVMKRPEVEARLKMLSLERAPEMSTAQFEDMIRRETAMWEGTAKTLGLFRTE